ncbi:MAG: hypothetical protein JEY97_09840 [Bacteroidales bacterium]|nr:hypothetical protein [Bacteroidales bacterium]
MKTSIKTPVSLIFLLGFFAIISSTIGIIDNSIYRDGEWANSQWLGQDIITLFVGVPLLIISTYFSVRKHSIRWILVLSGILLYFLYTFSFYVFVAKFSFLYLFHLPVFSLSMFSLILLAFRFPYNKLEFSYSKKTSKTIIIAYIFSISLILMVLWFNDIFSHVFIEGYQSETGNGEAPLIIFTLDLGIVIPLMIICVFGLIKKTKIGFILSGILLTKTTTLGITLMAMSLTMYLKHISTDTFLIGLWCVNGVIGLILTLIYFRNLKIKSSYQEEI